MVSNCRSSVFSPALICYFVTDAKRAAMHGRRIIESVGRPLTAVPIHSSFIIPHSSFPRSPVAGRRSSVRHSAAAYSVPAWWFCLTVERQRLNLNSLPVLFYLVLTSLKCQGPTYTEPLDIGSTTIIVFLLEETRIFSDSDFHGP